MSQTPAKKNPRLAATSGGTLRALSARVLCCTVAQLGTATHPKKLWVCVASPLVAIPMWLQEVNTTLTTAFDFFDWPLFFFFFVCYFALVL
jgi:hypothetical protein